MNEFSNMQNCKGSQLCDERVKHDGGGSESLGGNGSVISDPSEIRLFTSDQDLAQTRSSNTDHRGDENADAEDAFADFVAPGVRSTSASTPVPDQICEIDDDLHEELENADYDGIDVIGDLPLPKESETANSALDENDINAKDDLRIESNLRCSESEEIAEKPDAIGVSADSFEIQSSETTEGTFEQDQAWENDESSDAAYYLEDLNTGLLQPVAPAINQLFEAPMDIAMQCNDDSGAYGERLVLQIGSKVIPSYMSEPQAPVYELPEQIREQMEEIYAMLEKSKILDAMTHSNISWLTGDDKPVMKANTIITNFGKKAFDAVFTPEEIVRGRAGGGDRTKNPQIEKYDLNKICVISRFLGWLISNPVLFTFAEFKDYAKKLARECKNGLSETQRQYFKDNILFRYACDRRNDLQGKPKGRKKTTQESHGCIKKKSQSQDPGVDSQIQPKGKKKSGKRRSQSEPAEKSGPRTKRNKT